MIILYLLYNDEKTFRMADYDTELLSKQSEDTLMH